MKRFFGLCIAIVGGAIYLVALVVSFWLEDPKAETAHQ